MASGMIGQEVDQGTLYSIVSEPVADVAFTLTSRYLGARWLSERDLCRNVMSAARDRWLGQLSRGTAHMLDRVLVRADGNVAIEVELVAKTTKEYERIFRWYRISLAFPLVAWFCGTHSLQLKLTYLMGQERLDDS